MNKCLKYEILRAVLVMLVVIGHATYYTRYVFSYFS